MKSALKMDKICKAVNGCPYSVILGTETSWDESVKSEEVFGNRFNVFRDDRDPHLSGKESGGGVLVAIDVKFDAELIPSGKFKEFDHVWVKAVIASETHIFASVYFPPLQSNKQNFEKFFGDVEKILSNLEPETKIHIYGDFNQRTTDFIADEDNETILLPIVGENLTLQYFFEEISKFGLNQINHIKNSQNRYLDFLFTNLTEDFCVSRANFPLWRNEVFHTAIEYSQFVYERQMHNDWEYEEVYEYGKANLPEIKRRLNFINWQTLLGSISVMDQAVDQFYCLVHDILDDCVPKKRRRRHHTNDPPWFTGELRNLRNRKQKAHKRYKNSVGTENEPTFWQNYLEIHDMLNSKITTAQEEYHRKIESEIKSNPKSFYKYVKSKQTNNHFPSSMHLKERVGNDPNEISNLFADFFESVYTSFSEIDRDREYFSSVPEPHSSVTFNHLSPREIEMALEELDGSKGAGPDGIPPLLVKNLSNELSKPLFWLFNLSLRTGRFPIEWKKSFLVPIFKNGKKSDIENYRGVAIISCIPKLFEAIINKQIFIQVKHLISENQHGFFKGRSTATNLLQFVSFTLDAMDNGKFVQTLYTDFSKAFDRIDIPMLLFKLQKIGVENTLLNWIESYLSDRTQIVKFNGKFSRFIKVTSGVPQGSHLGPLLFILFINDVSSFLKHIKIITYADDMKLYMEIEKLSDVSLFQSEVDSFYQWCTKSLLQLNVKKCYIVSYTRKRSHIDVNITLGKQTVTKCDKIRDLGVILDSKLTFTDHYNTIIHKATNMLNFIKRFSYSFHDPYTLKTLYVSYVRSILEYCSIVWSPYQITHSDRIESVQKQFMLFALRKLGWTAWPLPSYESRCMLISLETLKKRREFASVSFVNDIVSQRVDCTDILSKLNFYSPTRNLRNRTLFLPDHHRTNYAKCSPLNQMMRLYNQHCEMIDLTMSRSSLRHYFNSLRN